MTSVIRGSDNFDSAATRSVIRLSESNGNGSTNTGVRRFSNVQQNTGTDVTYADSATDGASFLVNNAGVYSVQYGDSSTAAANIAITLNSTALTAANASTITAAQRLACVQSTGVTIPASITWVGYLPAGSVIRCQINAGAANAATNTAQMTIARVW